MKNSTVEKLSIDELTDLAQQYRNDTSEEGLKMSALLRSRLRRLTHDEIHKPTDPDGCRGEYFTVNIPRSVTGDIFTINDTQYLGECEVPACVLQTLMHMVYQNRKIDQERMRDNGRTIDIGVIGDRIAQYQWE